MATESKQGRTADPDPPANMTDDQTMPGFDGDAPRQIRAFPGSDAPPGSIIPPNAAQIENATYLQAGPEIRALVEDLIGKLPEFSDLRGRDIGVVWSRNQTKSLGGEPIMAWPALLGLLELHFAKVAEADLPEFAIVLSWKLADKLRGEGQYMHPEVLKRHLHFALMSIGTAEDGGVLSTRKPTLQLFPETVEAFGIHNPELHNLQRALFKWNPDGGVEAP